MSNKTIRVVARIVARPEKTAELRAVLIDLVEPTRREKGCISYQLHQNLANACDFVCVEEWESGSAIEAHMKTPHVQQAFAKAGPLLASAPDISSYSLIK